MPFRPKNESTLAGRCSGPGDPAWASGYIAIVDWVHRYYADREVLAQHYEGGAAYLEELLKGVANRSRLLLGS